MEIYGKKECKSMCEKEISVFSKEPEAPKTLNSDALKHLNQLKRLIYKQDSSCWQIGDLCVDLIDKYKLSLRQITQSVGYSRTRISHFHLTARTFPKGQRRGYTFQDSFTARQISIRFPRLNMSPCEISKFPKKKKKPMRKN